MLGLLATPIFGDPFYTWTLTPASGVDPAGSSIPLNAVFTNLRGTNQSIEFLSWQFDLGTFATSYTFQPGELSSGISAITLLPFETSTQYSVGILIPIPTVPSLQGSSFTLGPASVVSCEPGVSCFNSPVTISSNGSFEVTLGPPLIITPEPSTLVSAVLGLCGIVARRFISGATTGGSYARLRIARA